MKVLCAIDGSPGSDAAVRLLGQIVSGRTGEVVLYYSPPRVALSGRTTPSEEVLEQASEALAEKVFQRARSLLPESLSARTTDVVGQRKPRVGIELAAKTHRPDLIVVGARGTSRLGLPRIGSVSRAVVHTANVPVLVVRPHEHADEEPLRIALCCHQVEAAEVQCHMLQTLSFPASAVGQIVHVVESLFGENLPQWLEDEARNSTTDPIAKAFIEERDESFESIKQCLGGLREKLPAAFQASEPVIMEGHPGAQIVAHAEEGHIDLVVVGGHASSSALSRLFGGSTSEYVLAHATCSVLIVPQFDSP